MNTKPPKNGASTRKAGTFSPYSTTYFGKFRARQRPAGDFAVDRFNRQAGQIERWGLFKSSALADRQCSHVNRVLVERQAPQAPPLAEPLKVVADSSYYESDMARKLARKIIKPADVIDALAMEYASNENGGDAVNVWAQVCLKAVIEMITGREVEMEAAA